MQTSESMFDVDTVHRILVNLLQRIDEDDSGELSPCGYDSDGLNKSPSHSSVLKVGRLMDGYLAEIAPDPYLKLEKFMALIELLPEYARIVDDGLYRAIDIYLKAHPSLTESECKKLCKLIDWQKLSQDACSHAAQNDRLPIQMVVRVLYFEQLRLKSSFSGCGGGSGDGLISQRALHVQQQQRDNYASLRRENRELKLEISRMWMRLTELEREQGLIKQQGMRGDGRHGEHAWPGVPDVAVVGHWADHHVPGVLGREEPAAAEGDVRLKSEINVTVACDVISEDGSRRHCANRWLIKHK
ncbi:hypothetical protein C2845_PM09G19760 [Panicum miliaceum]|uniref:NPH3 domain-containing protein n=1 Tax=Panicum miliaceum TaxID=4540 RepID=A0A3L6RXU2_PANMI|nr:hypothetical protein C2845_PM09G19760 [Panicum miliaceum]